MKLYVFFVALFFYNHISYSQVKHDQLKPNVFGYEKPDKKWGIRYRCIPERVVGIIDTVVQRELSLSKSQLQFLIEFEQSNDTIELRGYVFKRFKRNSKERVYQIIKSTNRYIQIGKIIIPVYFSFDHEFACLNFVYTHSDFFIKFAYSRENGCRIIDVAYR